jgi:AI-2 transport protein TqsA
MRALRCNELPESAATCYNISMQTTSSTLKIENLVVILLGILVLIALAGVLYLLRGIILPFLVALFLAYLLEPLVRLLTRLHVPHAVATTTALLSTFILLVLMGILLYTGAQSFAKGYPLYEAKLRALLALTAGSLDFLPAEWQIGDLSRQLASKSVAGAILSSLGSFVTFTGHLLLVYIFTIFILVGQRHLPQRIHKAFDLEQAQRICDMLERITQELQTYLGTKAFISLVTGILVNVLLVFFDIDFAILWALLAFMLNFIPSIGSIVAAIPPILIAVLKFDSILPALWVAFYFTVINVVLGCLIEPKLMGQRLNLSPLLVILSLLFWGWLWGVTGMALAVPIMASIKIVCENIPQLCFVSVLMSSK